MVKRVFAAIGKAVCYILLFIGMQLLVSMVYALVGGMVYALDSVGGGFDITAFTDALTAFIYEKAVEMTLISNILTLLFLLAFFAIRKKSFLREIRFTRTMPGIAYVPVAIGGICLAGFISTVMSLLPIPAGVWEEYAEQSSLLGDTGIIAVLATVIIAPVTEEIIFRGLAYTRLRRAMPWWVAMLVSSAAFGLAHGQILWICYAFVMGLALCAVFERTGTVRASITLHLAFNLAGGYFFGGVPVSGFMAAVFAVGVTLCWIWLGYICPYTKLRPEDV